ncbi:MAG: hypothetical protein IH881_12990 [Myxococcales bacterium]|nr:hypothetical protein [Myxococcales bacterium]
MLKLRRSLVSVSIALGIAFGIAAGPLACAKTQSLLGLREAQEAEQGPVAPGEPGFDVAMIDKIIPGITPPDQIRGWFGEPDKRILRSDGTSEWIYNKARLRREDPQQLAQRRREEERARAAEAQKLREEVAALIKAGRRQIGRFAHWLDTNLFYPPRPKRPYGKVDKVAAEPPPPEVAAPVPVLRDPAHSELIPNANDDKKPVTLYDLTLTFTRDGVVDEFHYQRTVGREFIP